MKEKGKTNNVNNINNIKEQLTVCLEIHQSREEKKLFTYIYMSLYKFKYLWYHRPRCLKDETDKHMNRLPVDVDKILSES